MSPACPGFGADAALPIGSDALVSFVSLPRAESLHQVHEELPGAHSSP